MRKEHEEKMKKINDAINRWKGVDKKSTKIEDIIARIEVLEELLNLR